MPGAPSYLANARATAGPNDTIYLGLIGCGARGRGVHIPVFHKLRGARVIAVCDVNSKYLAQGRALAGGDSVAACSDYRKLLENKDVDAVIEHAHRVEESEAFLGFCASDRRRVWQPPMGRDGLSWPHRTRFLRGFIA